MTQSFHRDGSALTQRPHAATNEDDAVRPIRRRSFLQPAHAPAPPVTTLLREYFVCSEAPREAEGACSELWESALAGPLAEFLSRPSKQFRAHLVRLAHQLGGGTEPIAPELLAIIEVLHAGSLVIDDIEDGSAYRRGGPALHSTHGVPVALNAGNWLYFWPCVLLSRVQLPDATELALHRAIGRTLLACHEGQALDLSARVTEIAQSELPGVVRTTTRLKTGKLFELAAVLGATAAGASPSVVQTLGEFGEDIGVGLQMLDDAGGLVSATRSHKGHEDLVNARPTWVWAWAAERLAPEAYEDLRSLARKVAERDLHPELLAVELRRILGDRARRAVTDHLAHALQRLRRRLGASPVIDEIEKELVRMEASYG